jgi:hypothetical protein
MAAARPLPLRRWHCATTKIITPGVAVHAAIWRHMATSPDCAANCYGNHAAAATLIHCSQPRLECGRTSLNTGLAGILPPAGS